MPYVNIKITREGATAEQKAQLIQGVTQLLVDVLNAVAERLTPGGLCVFYVQDFAGARSLPDAIDAAFKGRSWRGAFWWDYIGETQAGPLRSGILAIRADSSPGWRDEQNEAPDMGCDDWWPYLAPLLGEEG